MMEKKYILKELRKEWLKELEEQFIRGKVKKGYENKFRKLEKKAWKTHGKLYKYKKKCKQALADFKIVTKEMDTCLK